MPKLRRLSSLSRTSGFWTVSSIPMKATRNTAATIARRRMKGEKNQSSLLPFLEHGLQRGKADRHRHDARPVALFQQREAHRLALEGQRERDDHDRARKRVDVKDGLPAVILGEIAADGRPDRRGEGHRDREQREPDRLLRLRQPGQHHGEGDGDQYRRR